MEDIVLNIISNNLIHRQGINLPLLNDILYDKLVKQYDQTILEEDYTISCSDQDQYLIPFTLYSLPKYNKCLKLNSFPLLVSMKLDGVSVCLGFIIHNDGITKKMTKELKYVFTKNTENLKNLNLLHKLKIKLNQLPITHQIVDEFCTNWIQTNIRNYTFTISLVVRCELIATSRTIEGYSSASNFASAAVNCEVSKFDLFKDRLTLKVIDLPYYICKKINKNYKRLIIYPTISDVFTAFKTTSVQNELVYNEKDFYTAFDKYINNNDFPCDGIVYSYPSWSYPSYNSIANKSVNYNKFAMKQENYYKSEIVSNPIYSINADNRLECSIGIKPTVIQGRTYTKCKFTISKFDTIGIGSIIELIFQCNQFPSINEVLTKSDNPFKPPSKCPFCNSSILVKTNKVINCSNNYCYEVHKSIMKKFFKKNKINITDKYYNQIYKNKDKNHVIRIMDFYELGILSNDNINILLNTLILELLFDVGLLSKIEKSKYALGTSYQLNKTFLTLIKELNDFDLIIDYILIKINILQRKIVISNTHFIGTDLNISSKSVFTYNLLFDLYQIYNNI